MDGGRRRFVFNAKEKSNACVFLSEIPCDIGQTAAGFLFAQTQIRRHYVDAAKELAEREDWRLNQQLRMNLAKFRVFVCVCFGLGAGNDDGVVWAQSAADGAGDDSKAESSLYTYKKVHDPTGIGKFYFGREIAQVMGHRGAGWLERSSREAEEAPSKLMEALKLRPGMAVADIGAGSGYFTRRIARRIGADGIVYAVDIQPEMLKILKANMESRGLTNYRLVQGTEKDPKLAEGSVDLAILVDVYHEFAFPHEMMTAIRRALKPGGRVVLVEYRGEDKWVPIKPLHKMTQSQVRKEAAAQGFKWIKTLDVLPRQHILIFGKE